MLGPFREERVCEVRHVAGSQFAEDVSMRSTVADCSDAGAFHRFHNVREFILGLGLFVETAVVRAVSLPKERDRFWSGFRGEAA